MKRIVFFVITLAAACNTSSDPYSLNQAQILAVRSEPAHAAPGASVRIDVLASDEAGNVFVTVPDHVDAGGLPVMRGSDGWYVQGPAMPAAPTANVELTVDGQVLPATKQLLFQDDRPNPSVTTMQVDGSASEAIAVAKNAKTTLGVAASGDGTFAYAWYTSLGKLEHYRSANATFDANEQGDGAVAVVVRDDQGGVAWQIVPASVQ
jgi:hypothetical protein